MKSAYPHRCWVEIAHDALRHNAAVAHRASRCGLIAIIKADAYGHGAAQVARTLIDDVEMFGVATISEALELRAAKIKTPVLLLGASLPDERDIVIAKQLTPSISSLAEARAWDALVKKKRAARLDVHAVLDTGMGRIGFTQAEWNPRTIAALATLENIRVEAVASHFPSADEDRRFTEKQIETFGALHMRAVEHGLTPPFAHLGNSAGILGHPELHQVSNLARPGLMLYGVSPKPEFQSLLKPALAWKTHITLVRALPKGSSISYGRTFKTRKPARVATLAVGYADGYPRHLSGAGAHVLISGARCPVLGRVTMDQIMVDVSKVPAAIGDEAVLIGVQGKEQISAAELAEKAGTIPWEILTRITARVSRVHLG